MVQKTLAAGRFNGAEFRRRSWFALIPADTTLDEIIHPSYWAHLAKKINIGDLIEANAEDGTFFQVFRVVGKGGDGKTLLLRQLYGYGTEPEVVAAAEVVAAEVSDRYEVKWGGPKALWRVIDLATKLPVASKLGTREEAAAEAYRLKQTAMAA